MLQHKTSNVEAWRTPHGKITDFHLLESCSHFSIGFYFCTFSQTSVVLWENTLFGTVLKNSRIR